jgi:hypothetical protein
MAHSNCLMLPVRCEENASARGRFGSFPCDRKLGVFRKLGSNTNVIETSHLVNSIPFVHRSHFMRECHRNSAEYHSCHVFELDSAPNECCGCRYFAAESKDRAQNGKSRCIKVRVVDRFDEVDLMRF